MYLMMAKPVIWNAILGKSMDEAESGVSISVTQLLCTSGEVDGVPVKFLVDSGASGNFISEHLVSEHDLRTVRSHEKMQVHLADGFLRASNLIVQSMHMLTYEEHAEFSGFPCDENFPSMMRSWGSHG